METCDTNILFDSLNPESPFHRNASAYLRRQSENEEFVLCELVLSELYGLLRSAAISRKPMTASQAAAMIQELRSNPRWRVYDYPGGLMNDVWKRAAAMQFPRTGIYDARLALTLRHFGVTRFATRNVKHFAGYGFERVFDPTA